MCEIKQKELLIIIPAYNEEKNIVALIEKMNQEKLSDYADILVINDASLDNTSALCRKAGFKVVDHVYNLGYGSGLQTGYRYAVKHNYLYIIQMDADGQHDISNVKNIYEELKKADETGYCPDIVIGSRYVKGAVKYKTSFLKSVAYMMFRFLILQGTGRKIMDPTSGLQGLNYKAFYFYSRYNHFDDRYPDANMIMQMLLLGFEIKEIPALMHYRTEGTSMHSGFKPVIYMFRMVFSIIAVFVRTRIYQVDADIRRENMNEKRGIYSRKAGRKQ